MFDLIFFLVLFLRKTLYVVKAIFILGCGLLKPRVYFFEIAYNFIDFDTDT